MLRSRAVRPKASPQESLSSLAPDANPRISRWVLHHRYSSSRKKPSFRLSLSAFLWLDIHFFVVAILHLSSLLLHRSVVTCCRLRDFKTEPLCSFCGCSVMRYLMDIGLSEEEVSSMVSRFSPLLGYSIEAVFKPKLEFLLTTMQKPLKELVEYPRYFSYSLDKKIKPRFWVLKSRNISCRLKDMLEY